MGADVIKFPGSEDETPPTETVKTPTVTDRILAVSEDFRGRMEAMADPAGIWKQSTTEMHNETNRQKQRTFVRAILSGLALGKSNEELLAVVERWQRAVHSEDVGDTGLANSIAVILENATDMEGEFRTASITASMHWHMTHNDTVPGIQPAGSESVPIPRRAA